MNTTQPLTPLEIRAATLYANRFAEGGWMTPAQERENLKDCLEDWPFLKPSIQAKYLKLAEENYMATRSTIAMRYPDGHVKAVYAHWDGYPSHNGKILLEHYSNPWLLDCLLRLGAISVLTPKLGRQHPFDYKFDPSLETTAEQKAKWDTWTMAYHRDRGEELRIMEFDSVAQYRKELPTEEFNYLYLPTSGWEYTKGDNKHRFGLRETLAELEKHRDED